MIAFATSSAAQRRPPSPGVRARHVPQIMQLETIECGAACLAMVAAYYGKWIPLEQVRADCSVSRNGSNALNLVKAARRYGFVAKGYRYEPQELREKATFPCIVHWEFNHFIVVRGFRGKKVDVNDPALGEYTMSWDDFDRGFTGVCLCITPGPRFQPSGKAASLRDFMVSHLHGSKSALIFVALTAAIISLFGILYPAFSQVFLDHLLIDRELDWFTPFTALLALLCLIEGVVSLLNATALRKLKAKLAVVSNAAFMWKMLHLPIEFFSQRGVGDLNERIRSSTHISQSLIGVVVPLAVNVVMLAIYLVVMFAYSWFLALIGMISMLVNFGFARFLSHRRMNATRMLMSAEENKAMTTINGIAMIETLKSSGAVSGFFQRWSGYQASANNQRGRFAKSDAYLSLVPQCVTSFSTIAVLIVGLWLVMHGEFTIGMVLAFQGYLMGFVTPTGKLSEVFQTLREVRTSMERIQDVMNYDDDPLAAINKTPTAENYQKLRGEVTLKNITFGYSSFDAPLIDDFSLHIPAGNSVGLVGASGSGKSTIVKLITGVYLPWSGAVSFDGRPLDDIPKAIRCGSIAVVDQDIVLFNDTIANNIRLWDESIEDFEVILAARDARVHHDIIKKDGGYDHVLLADGRDLSGGQRQQMEIARALAQDPTILLLDEATSSLDAKTEQEVMESIRKRGITCIVISHRRSTLQGCDEIVVVDHGRIVEHGVPQELLSQKSRYAELITSE